MKFDLHLRLQRDVNTSSAPEQIYRLTSFNTVPLESTIKCIADVLMLAKSITDEDVQKF